MSSILKKYPIVAREGGSHFLVTATMQQTKNDYNGNPQYLVQLWLNKHLWYPKVNGYRYRKTNDYKMTSYNIESTLDDFMNDLQKSIYED